MGNKKSNEEDLRIADDFLAKLEKNYPEVYKYLVKKANEKENGVYKYYLGVRNNS